MNEHALQKAIVILAIDDPWKDNQMKDYLAERLQWDMKYDLEIHAVDNGRAALDLMETITPDFIIADRMMPEMDGEQLFEAVRERLAWRDIPFIILTAAGAPQPILKGWNRGVDKYIIKPFNDDHFVDLVESTLDTYLPKRNS